MGPATPEATSMWTLVFLVLVVGAAAVVGGVFLFQVFAYARRGLYLRQTGESDNTPTLRLLQLITWEVFAILVLASWAVRARVARLLPATASAGRPVLLVHGLSADGTTMWGYERAIRRRGRPARSIDLGSMMRPVSAYAPALASALERMLREHPDADGIDVIAHSMGGIVLRACLALHPELAAQVRVVVTVGSPHGGTAGARGLRLPEARDLAWGSAWLTQLPTLKTLLPHARIVALASTHDAIVYPFGTALPGDFSRQETLPLLGHAELLTRRAVAERIADILAEADATVPTSPEPAPPDVAAPA